MGCGGPAPVRCHLKQAAPLRRALPTDPMKPREIDAGRVGASLSCSRAADADPGPGHGSIRGAAASRTPSPGAGSPPGPSHHVLRTPRSASTPRGIHVTHEYSAARYPHRIPEGHHRNQQVIATLSSLLALTHFLFSALLRSLTKCQTGGSLPSVVLSPCVLLASTLSFESVKCVFLIHTPYPIISKPNIPEYFKRDFF